MKKLLTLLLSILLLITLAVSSFGCTQTKDALSVYVPDGAPALSFASLMKEGAKVDGREVKVTVTTADNVKAALISGNADAVILPTNAAAALFNTGKDIKLGGVTVWGLLYMVGKTELTDINALKGKIVYNIGRGDTPDVVFKKILAYNGIEYVEDSETAVEGKVVLKYVSAGSELIPLLKQGKAEYGILGEPAVTQATAKVPCSVVMNLQTEWKKATNSDTDGFPQAGVIFSKKVYEDEGLANALLSALKANDDYIKENASELSSLIKANGSTLEVNFTRETVERCNIKTLSANEAKASLISYYNVLKDFDPSKIGGKLPDDAIYYAK